MRKIIGSSLAAAVLLAAGIAHADNVEGTIEQIDRDANQMIVDGQVFEVSEEMTAGATLDDLKEGDKVNVFFKHEEGGDEDDQFRAMQVDKISEQRTGGVAGVVADRLPAGTVQNIDLTANPFEVEGQLFAASAQNTVGPEFSELRKVRR